MDIDDYIKAECTLYRMPTINLSIYGNDIAKALVDAWRNGQSIDDAMRSLNTSGVAQDIRSKIKDNYSFQKKQMLERITRDSSSEIDGLSKDRDKLLKETEERYLAIQKAKAEKLALDAQKYDATNEVYTSTQSKVERIRRAILEKKQKLGSNNLNDILNKDINSVTGIGRTVEFPQTPFSKPYDSNTSTDPTMLDPNAPVYGPNLPPDGVINPVPKRSLWKKILGFFGYKK